MNMSNLSRWGSAPKRRSREGGGPTPPKRPDVPPIWTGRAEEFQQRLMGGGPTDRPLLKFMNNEKYLCYANSGTNALLAPAVCDFLARQPRSEHKLISMMHGFATAMPSQVGIDIMCLNKRGLQEMPRYVYGLRRRLADQVDSAKEFMEERQQDVHQWIIALVRAIGELLRQEATTEWNELITTAVSTEFMCTSCQTVDIWPAVNENCISVSVVDAHNPDVHLTSLKEVVNQYFRGDVVKERTCGHCRTSGATKRSSIRRLPQVMNII